MKLLLFPGFDGTGQFFEDFVQKLPPHQSFQILKYPEDTALSYDGLVDYFLPQLPKDDFVLLGESFGGPLCIKLASKAPDNLRGIILVATFATEPLPNILRIIVNFNLRFGILKIPTFFINHFLINGSNMALARNVSSIVNSMKDDVITTRAKTALSVNVLSNLGEISVPALIIEAKNDWLLRKNTSKEMQKYLSKSKLAELEGPHFLLQTSPDKAASLICDFISSIEDLKPQ